ncbi:hypothetical protein KJA17_01975 [Patescibacteria group bacterium]|nr:hypothetical protein [Patescibacteria group bacterium]
MKFLKLSKPKEEEFLVLDFGSGSIKGLIFEPRAKKNIIKKFSIQDIEKFGVFTAANFEWEVIKEAAKKVIEGLEIEKQVSEIPALVGFSPKILKGKIIEVPFKRENPEPKIARDEEQKIHHYVLERAEKQVSQESLKEFGIIPQDLQTLKKEILEKKISDYKVPSILGHKGENLDFKILIIFGLRDNLKIVPQLKSFFGFKEINLFHEIEGLVSFSSGDKDISGIFLDIGAETTQIFSVKKGMEWMEEFPMAGNAFTREICQGLGSSEREGENLKRRLSKNQLSPGTRERIENLISETSKIWFSQMKEKLKKKAKIYSPLLSVFYLFGGGSCLPAIKKVLEEENFKDLPISQNIKVRFLNLEDLPLEARTGVPLPARTIPSILLSFCEYAKKNL